jgi:tRNA threonylcarbamoyladenosine modification (KEOPS) complex  Pcc1 subunit
VTNELRGSVHSDSTARKLADEPAMRAAMEEMSSSKLEMARDKIHNAIDATDGRTLKGWVAVACWEDEAGVVGQSVIEDIDSTPIQTKGMLHSAVWSVAHDKV